MNYVSKLVTFRRYICSCPRQHRFRSSSRRCFDHKICSPKHDAYRRFYFSTPRNHINNMSNAHVTSAIYCPNSLAPIGYGQSFFVVILFHTVCIASANINNFQWDIFDLFIHSGSLFHNRVLTHFSLSALISERTEKDQRLPINTYPQNENKMNVICKISLSLFGQYTQSTVDHFPSPNPYFLFLSVL